MFPVVTIPFTVITPAFIGDMGVLIRRRTAWNIGVHVPYLPVGFVVCRLISRVQVIVRLYRVVLDDVVQRRFQGGPGLACRVVIIPRGKPLVISKTCKKTMQETSRNNFLF